MRNLGKELIDTDAWFEKAKEYAKQFHAMAQLEQRPRPKVIRETITHYGDLASDAIVQAIECATNALTLVVLHAAAAIKEPNANSDQISRSQAADIERRIDWLRACEGFEIALRPHRDRWARGIYDGPECDELRRAGEQGP